MKKTKLFIATVIIVTLLASSLAPIVYAVDELNSPKDTNIANTETDTEETIDKEENTDETEKLENASEEEFQEKIKKIYGEPVILINGQITKNSRLDFSSNAMPKLQIKILKNGELEDFKKDAKKGITVLTDASIDEDGTVLIKKVGCTVLEFAYKYPSLIIFSKTRTIKKVNVWVSEYNPTKYDITLDASVEDTQNGFAYNSAKKLVTIQKGKVTNSFRYENGTGNLLNDVTAIVEDENIAKVVEGVNGSKKIEGISVGETKLHFTGDSVKNGTSTFTIKVVENLYQYDKEQDTNKKPGNSSSSSGNKNPGNNTSKPSTDEKEPAVDDKEDNKQEDSEEDKKDDDIIPDDFDFTQYEEREDVSTDYTKLNEELLKNTDTLEVTVEGNHVVKADVFKTLKKYSNKKLQINSTASGVGRISWVFDSNTITKTNIDFNPSAQFSADKLSNIESNKAEHGIFMDLAHSGELPGKATVSLWLGDSLAEKYIDNVNEVIYLYYYNPTKKDYEYVGIAKMVDYGTVGFELEHCSIYLLSTEKLEGKTTRPIDSEPKTGVQNYLVVAIVVAVISLAGIIILKKHETKNIE